MSVLPIAQVADDDAPIACTLTVSEHRSRTRDLSELAQRALLTREPIAGGERLTFVDIPAIEGQLAAAVAAEATCCSFLNLHLRRRDDALALDVTGPPDAQPIIAELFA